MSHDTNNWSVIATFIMYMSGTMQVNMLKEQTTYQHINEWSADYKHGLSTIVTRCPSQHTWQHHYSPDKGSHIALDKIEVTIQK